MRPAKPPAALPLGRIVDTMMGGKNQSDVLIIPIRLSVSILPVSPRSSRRPQRRMDRPNASRCITFSSLIRAPDSADTTIARDKALVRTAPRVEGSIRLRLRIFAGGASCAFSRIPIVEDRTRRSKVAIHSPPLPCKRRQSEHKIRGFGPCSQFAGSWLSARC